jgi:hypothetical protein
MKKYAIYERCMVKIFLGLDLFDFVSYIRAVVCYKSSGKRKERGNIEFVFLFVMLVQIFEVTKHEPASYVVIPGNKYVRTAWNSFGFKSLASQNVHNCKIPRTSKIECTLNSGRRINHVPSNAIMQIIWC